MSEEERLKQFLLSHIRENNLTESLEIPRKWERYGDFVLFDERTFSSETWKEQTEQFWRGISDILKCKRIGLKSKITNDGYRTPNVIILHGSDPWISHKENSITYTWNVERSMFSAGNVCERMRVGQMDCSSEVVVDLFAGIGYFTLPFLVHSKARFVHACEWNPAALEALRRNLRLNKVEERCEIHEGDSLAVCPKKIAHRVYLGLIPSSERYWRTACDALVRGGKLHVHENVETKKEDIVCEKCRVLYSEISPELNLDSTKKTGLIMNTIRMFGKTDGNISWKHKQWLVKAIHLLHSLIYILGDKEHTLSWCAIRNVNFVKSYAPHVDHLVYDVEISCFDRDDEIRLFPEFRKLYTKFDSRNFG